MIVKKMPILQGFPDFDTVKNLSKTTVGSEVFRPVFYDIETTGLSRYSTFLYLIGAVTYENSQWYLQQWMAEDSKEEALILCEFCDYLKDKTCMIQYNGNRFDQPYLEERYRSWGYASPFQGLSSLDLYQELKPCKNLLKLSRMKQPDLEAFLGMESRNFCDGGMCVRLYRKYIKSKDPKPAEIMLGHNREDLLGLGAVFSMLGYKSLLEGNYEPSEASVQDGQLLLTLSLPFLLPAAVSVGNKEFYLTASGNTAKFLTGLKNGKLRQYYKNFKDYDYLPGEDTAVPKVLSQYMDKSLRVPATASTSYTWFPCSKEFLDNKDKQLQYLRHSLPCLLAQLETKK